ncbi:MAG: ascorbate-dependent monooxygenase [Acidobacteriia bacterium]|nr:ascorbate-dependent monooxygenase [Terriglobia bacterium]
MAAHGLRLAMLAGVAAALWAKGSGVTFSHDVAPVLYHHCATCHHAGAVAPFPLITYADAARRADLIAAVTANRYMPPWLPAAPRFAGERRLTDAEIALLARWAAAGAPEGDPAETPPAPHFPEGWSLGAPDLEAEIPSPFQVPAEGPDLYRCFSVRLPHHAQHYVRAIEIRPGDPKVVHHALLFQDVTGTARKRDAGSGYDCFGTPGFLPARGLGGWTPGSGAITMLPGIAETLYAEADLVIQVHYHPTGRPETDRTRLALYYTSEKPRRHLIDVGLTSNRIDIPPGARDFRVTDHFTLPVDVDLLGIIPHAHYIARDMLGYAVLPDGTRRTLIHIPDWNFNWQEQYRYSAPIRLPSGTRVEMEFTYDNSEANPRNPNHPPRRVIYGPASTDEMAGLHLQVAPARESELEELDQAIWGKMMRMLGGGVYRQPEK